MNSGSGAVNISAPLTLASVNFESQGSEVSIMVNTSSGLLPDRIYSVDVVARSAVNAVNTSFSVCKQMFLYQMEHNVVVYFVC